MSNQIQSDGLPAIAKQPASVEDLWHEYLRSRDHILQRLKRIFRTKYPLLNEDDYSQILVAALIKAQRLIASYDPAKSSLSTWLQMITHSCAVDYWRRSRREQTSLSPELLLDQYVDVEDASEALLNQQLLIESILATLDETERDIIYWRVEGIPWNDIAQRLTGTVSVKALRTRYCRMIKRLNERFSVNIIPEEDVENDPPTE